MTRVTDPELLARLNGGAQPIVTPLPSSPKDQAREDRDNAAANRDDIRTGIAVRGEQRDIGYKGNDYVLKLASDYNADPTVKAYRVAIAQLAQALGTGEGPQADLALTYAFAKAMDPESVVRESEQGMVTESQPWFQSAVEKTRKQFGMDGAGNYTPETRQALRVQINNAVGQRAKIYDARRGYYEGLAQQIGADPQVVLGQHDAAPFVPVLEEWVARSSAPPLAAAGPAGDEQEGLAGVVSDDTPSPYDPGGPLRTARTGGWGQSPAAQSVYGANEGIASTLGAPFDVVNAIDTGLTTGINSIFGTDLQANDRPLGGSDWWQDKFRDWGFVGSDPEGGVNQFVRRAGQSVGAAMVPTGLAANTARQGAMGLMSALGGGAGAATAQQAFPGNPAAEFAGEVLGSAASGGAMLGLGRARAQRATEDAVPTVPQLKEQAGQMYRAAEARGATAEPMQTEELAAAMRGALRDEGRVSPTGRISEVYPKAREAMQLVDDYSGQPMTPTQLQTVRSVVADGMMSQDPSERRIASMLLDTFDDWADPLAPELPEARAVASRYLNAEKLEQARELAGADASQFTGSGFENALRRRYREIDRNTIKGKDRYSDELTSAIQTVSRGTPASNTARALGRFAPTGVVSAGLGVGAPTAIGTMVGDPTLGLALGTATAGLGTAGRMAATRMGINNARRAEVIARNGGELAKVPLMNPETERLFSAIAAAQLGQYGDPANAQQQEGAGDPQPFAGREGQKPRRRGLFGSTGR